MMVYEIITTSLDKFSSPLIYLQQPEALFALLK